MGNGLFSDVVGISMSVRHMEIKKMFKAIVVGDN